MQTGVRRGRGGTLVAAIAGLAAATACGSAPAEDAPRAAPVRQVMRVQGSGTVEIHTEAAVSARTFQVPAREVWEALPSVYERLEIPVTSLDPTDMEIGNPGFMARRVEGKRMNSYLDCGTTLGGSIANSHDVTLSVVTRVSSPETGVTRLVTVVDATAEARATSGQPIHCQSRGVLEERVERLVAERLAGIS